MHAPLRLGSYGRRCCRLRLESSDDEHASRRRDHFRLDPLHHARPATQLTFNMPAPAAGRALMAVSVSAAPCQTPLCLGHREPRNDADHVPSRSANTADICNMARPWGVVASIASYWHKSPH